MMEQRQYLAPNGRKSVVKEFRAAAIHYPKSNERQSTFAYARAGLSMDGAQGGGNRVTR